MRGGYSAGPLHCLALLLTAASAACSGDATSAQERSSADLTAALDSVVQAHVDHDMVPGVSVAVVPKPLRCFE